MSDSTKSILAFYAAVLGTSVGFYWGFKLGIRSKRHLAIAYNAAMRGWQDTIEGLKHAAERERRLMERIKELESSKRKDVFPGDEWKHQ